MSNLTYPTSDFVAFTKIKSAEVTGKFDAIETKFNSTDQINRSAIEYGTAAHVVINHASTGALSSEAQLDETRGGTGIGTYTTGDILYASGANTLAKLAIGSSGNFLGISGGVPAWATPGGNLAVTSKTTTYTITTSDDVVLCSGSAFTVTLPAATNTGKVIRVLKTDSTLTNIITIARAGSDTIDGATSVTLNTQYDSYTLVADGTATWKVLSHEFPTGWISFTPTLNSTTNVGTNSAQYRRLTSDSIEIQGYIRWTGNGDNASLTSALPNSWTFDTAKLAVTTADRAMVGHCMASRAAFLPGAVFYDDTTKVAFIISGDGTIVNGNTFTNTAEFMYQYLAPISGWPSK